MALKDQPLAFIDLETTGFNIAYHEIIQIGCVLARQVPRAGMGPDLAIVEEFELMVLPERIETADRKALEVNGYSNEAWKGALTLPEAMRIMAEKTAGAVMVGHNVAFDWAFLEKAFLDTGVPHQMHYHRLDTLVIAYAMLYDTPEMNVFSLGALCNHYGIQNEKAHTALSDAKATYELYRRLLVKESPQKRLF